MNMHISLFAYLDNTKMALEIEFNFIRCQFHKPKLSQSRNMNGFLFVLSNSKISHWLPWKQKGFIFAYRNKFILINFACLIALTINIKDLTL